jgi:hypothetical protein
MSLVRASVSVPPYFGAAALGAAGVAGVIGAVGAAGAFGVVGVEGAEGVVGLVGAAGVVGADAGPQAANTRDKTIKTLTISHRTLFLIFPPVIDSVLLVGAVGGGSYTQSAFPGRGKAD